MQLNNRGIARASDGWFRYDTVGSRMSGDMNTSMGNKLLMCLMAKSYIDSKKFDIEFINNGDDCLMMLDRKNLRGIDDLHEYFAAFGFNIVREEPVYTLEQIEFCQTKMVCASGTYRMVRKLRTCLTKDVTCVNLGHDVESYRKLLFDIGKCGKSIANDVPILGAFYRMLERFGVEGRYQGKWDTDYSYYHMASRNTHTTSDTCDSYSRYSYWLQTGISPDEQEIFENYFDESVWGADKRQFIDLQLINLIK